MVVFLCFMLGISNLQLLLICLTVSSKKDLSIAPCFIGVFSLHMQSIKGMNLQ